MEHRRINSIAKRQSHMMIKRSRPSLFPSYYRSGWTRGENGLIQSGENGSQACLSLCREG